jgi:hypothetical protein
MRHLALFSLLLALTGCSLSPSADPMGDDIAEADATVRGETPTYWLSWWDSTVEFFGRIGGPEPAEMADKLVSDKPDERLEAINYLASYDWGRQPPYTDRYDQIARGDPSPLVRAVAVRALNRSRAASPEGTVRGMLNDPSELVRLEAAKALSNTYDPQASEKLRAMLTAAGETRDVRIAVADALRHDRTPEGYRTLVGVLGDRDFAVAWTARRSLRRMTGQDFRWSEADWAKWLANNSLS